MSTQLLDMAVVRIDGDTQPRAEINQEIVKEYAEAMQAGTEFPPVEVICDGAEYWLVDGFHRYYAHRQLEKRQIRSAVSTGLKSEAQWLSLGANKAHGLRRTNLDKAKAAIRALKMRPDCSDAVIAQHIGVSAPTVGKYRASMSATQKVFESPARKGRDGRHYRVPARHQQSRARSGGISPNAFTPVRTGSAPAPMTAINMPHDPEMGARTLIEVFGPDYLRPMIAFLTRHLEGVQA